MVALDELVDLRSGGTPSKSNPEFWGGATPWVSAKDMYVDWLHDAEDHVTDLAVGNGTRMVPAGTILIVVRGMGLAKAMPIARTTLPVAFNQDLKALVVTSERVSEDYLFAALRAQKEILRGYADEAAHGTKRIQTDRLLSLPIPLPPATTQRRIAAIMSAYDDLIEANTRRSAVLEEMARRVYNEWFVHFRFPGGDGQRPADWHRGTLGGILALKYGKALKASDRRGGSVAVYGSSGVVGAHDKALVKGPGIVVGRKGNVGSVFWSQSDFFPIDTAYYVETKRPLEYAYQLLHSYTFESNDAAVPGLNRDYAHSREADVAPTELVTKYADLVRPMFGLVEGLIQLNANLRAQRDLLLPRLVSGKLTVDDAERQVGKTAA
jgi:type I restriction enzyme S subunit